MNSDDASPDAVIRAIQGMTEEDLDAIADQSADAACDLMTNGMIAVGPFLTHIVNGQVVTEVVD